MRHLVLELLGDLLAPRACAACDAPARRAVFCAGCAATALAAPPAPPPAPPHAAKAPALRVEAAFGYGGAVATAIRRLKYEDRPDLAVPLAHAVAGASRRHLGARTGDVPPTLTVPVPLGARRLAERGYNQAALLARALHGLGAVPAVAHLLVRRRETPPQATLDGVARRMNVRDAFVAHGRARGARIVLVDDVCTTGATLDAAAEALRAAGATVEGALVVATALTSRDAGPHGSDDDERDDQERP